MSFLTLLGLATVLAAEPSFYLESSPQATRAAAAEIVRQAATTGISARVVRLYVPDLGWRYVFRSEPSEQPAQLEERALAMGRARSALFVVEVESGRSRPLVPGTATAAPVGAPDPSNGPEHVLARLARSLSGPIDAAPPFQDTYVFRFRRTTPEWTVEHVMARREDDLYLQVDVLTGPGRDSKVGVVAGTPWTDVPLGGTLDADRVRRQFERFSPPKVLAIPTELWTGDLAAGDLEDLVVAGEVDIDGEVAIELSRPAWQERPAVSLFVSRSTWRLVATSVGADADQVRRHFTAWRELGDGRVVPTRIETWQGGALVETVEVLELDLEPTLPVEWFPVAGG